jgi:hypothetical protein
MKLMNSYNAYKYKKKNWMEELLIIVPLKKLI